MMPVNRKTRRPSPRERRAIDQAAREIEEVEGRPIVKNPTRQKQRREDRAKHRRRCPGLNIRGEPCGTPPLREGTVIEGVAASGVYCLHHDPDLPADAWKNYFQQPGAKTATARVYSRRRPYELVANAILKSPEILIRPHLEALGLEWDAATESIVPKVRANGSRDPGATHIGFSREGYAKKSKHKDLALQIRAMEMIGDRLYGKAKMALDVAASSSQVPPVIPADGKRGLEVATVLAQCGAIPSADEISADEEE